MCRNQLAKVYKHLGNKECLRKNQRKVYAKDLDAACWVKYPHNIKVVINTAQILYCGVLRLIFVGSNVYNSIKMNL